MEIPSGKIALKPGNLYNIRKQWGEYLGVFESKADVPHQAGYFVIGNLLYRRKTVFLLPDAESERNSKPRVNNDSSRVLNTAIRPDDNELKVLIKELYKGTTLQEFKEMYPEVSDMNNARRTIECAGQGNLSWNRFLDFIHRKGATHLLSIISTEGFEADVRTSVD